MNIAKVMEETLGDEERTDRTEWYKTRQQQIIRILEALRAIHGSKHWKTLNELLWKDIITSLENTLRNTSDEKQIYRLQGQLVWSRNYADFGKMIARFENELLGLNNQIHGEDKESG